MDWPQWFDRAPETPTAGKGMSVIAQAVKYFRPAEQPYQA
jgi:hypothetical protein